MRDVFLRFYYDATPNAYASVLVHQSLSVKALQGFVRSITIGGFAKVVSKIKLAQVSVKMLAAYMMIDAIDAALESGKVSLDRISSHANTFVVSHVLICGMVHERMRPARSFLSQYTSISH